MNEYIQLPTRAKDIKSKRFGRLVALGPVELRRPGGVFWLCRCDCGNTTMVLVRHLLSGNTRSCGCLRWVGTHKKTGTPLYSTWAAMCCRCHSHTSDSFENYGARGIVVCAAWRTSFEEFEFYVAQLPHYGKKGYTLDRIDNDGNYEPGNVRWATHKEQRRNSRRNRMIAYGGRTQCQMDWAKEIGMSAQCLRSRLKAGWSIEEALTTPLGTSRKAKDALQGEYQQEGQ